MGLIRGGLLVIASVLLFLLFLAGNLFFAFNLSLDYNNVQTELKPIITDIVEKNNLRQNINQEFWVMESYCQNNSEYVFSNENSGDFNYVFSIPCDVVSQGPESVIDYGINSLIEKSYYKDYNCNFWDCFKQKDPLFLFSKQAQDYWNSKFYLILSLSIVLIILIFLLAEKKSNFPVIIGSLLVLSSMLLKLSSAFFLKLALSTLSFFTEFDSSFDMFNFVLVQLNSVILITFIIGIIILAIGIILKLFKVGFKISNIFSKLQKEDEGSKEISKEEVKEIVKKEVEKIKDIKKSKKK